MFLSAINRLFELKKVLCSVFFFFLLSFSLQADKEEFPNFDWQERQPYCVACIPGLDVFS